MLAGPTGIRAAGGVIAQVMPGARDTTVTALERAVGSMAPVTTQIVDGADATGLLQAVAGSLDLKIYDAFDVAFDCLCTREKVEAALLGLGKDELAKIAREQPETEATCDFCARRYLLSAEDVRALSARF